MKVVVAYCQLHPETAVAAWNEFTPDDSFWFADTSGSDTAYFETLAEHWADGETFVLLEQDKIPAPGALRDLYSCEHPWCSYPVPMAHNGEPCDFVSLSCTKFGSELMKRWPDLMDAVGKRDMGYGPKHWNRLDIAMAFELWRRIGPVHWHPAGMVEHKHESVGVSA